MKIQKDSNPNNNLKYISIIVSIVIIVSFFFLPFIEFKKENMFGGKVMSIFDWIDFIFSLAGWFNPQLILIHLILLLPIISVFCILCNIFDYKSVQINIEKKFPLNIVFGFISLILIIDIYNQYSASAHILSYGFYLMLLSSLVMFGIGLLELNSSNIIDSNSPDSKSEEELFL